MTQGADSPVGTDMERASGSPSFDGAMAVLLKYTWGNGLEPNELLAFMVDS